MAVGAYLIALWAVGVVLVVSAVFYVLVLWDDGRPSRAELPPVETVLDRFRQSR